ncbi:MAG TPA: lactate racemase domain-containing protein [Bacteroidota bacterium]|nr:lactate racemase domain-containing protein [Bacteroidota bacterium]
MVIGNGAISRERTEEEVYALSERALAQLPLAGKRVLVIIPDTTRHAELPLFFKTLARILGGKVAALDYLVATGTHHPLGIDVLLKHVGITEEEYKSRHTRTKFFNHLHTDRSQLRTIGRIPAREISEISQGLYAEDVDVTINKLIFEYDQLILVSPVVPHETVGFAGGNKYFFPGIGGEEIIQTFHWIGALLTNPVVNGVKDTLVRRVINRGATFITVPRICFAFVVDDHKVSSLYIGSPEEAWEKAADDSAKVHIKYLDHPVKTVLGIAPSIYEDIWVAGKVMYKHEPVIADGGEVIIYAPHIDEISYSHGKEIRKVGYHVRDYFVRQWKKFEGTSRLILAHSTNVRGIGSFENGVEKPRINVTLATAIPESECRAVNLGYRDYRTIDIEEWKSRQNGDLLVVENAGQLLYRLR